MNHSMEWKRPDRIIQDRLHISAFRRDPRICYSLLAVKCRTSQEVHKFTPYSILSSPKYE